MFWFDVREIELQLNSVRLLNLSLFKSAIKSLDALDHAESLVDQNYVVAIGADQMKQPGLNDSIKMRFDQFLESDDMCKL